jgi:CPA1 family monovalent cation:H+ antiporter
MNLLDIIALLIGLSALGGYINHHFLRLPHTIGLVVIALCASGVIILIDWLLPPLNIAQSVAVGLQVIDFQKAFLEGMLSALLFAGAVHTDVSALARRKWAILAMATVGVAISTLVVGGAMWAIGQLVGIKIPFIWACVLGALISPTDPVAVMGVFRRVAVPPELEAKIAGESLLNDGAGIVAFTLCVALATGKISGADLTAWTLTKMFLWEAGGGILLGVGCGLVAYLLMRSIEEHNIEVMITIALMAATYALALRAHVSGPIAVVVAGLLIGNHGKILTMGESVREHVYQFWALTDEILNSVLFLLIGLEVLVIKVRPEFAWYALAAIPVVIAARWISVVVPIGVLSLRERFEKGTITVMTWGGLRGGVSVALALSLPLDATWTPAILAATYAVVVFSIIVQGLTMERVVTRAVGKPAAGAAPATALPLVAREKPGERIGKRAQRRQRGPDGSEQS